MPPLSKKDTGTLYEQQACRFLERQGLFVIDKNVRLKCGELDIIMQDGSCIVFVEVKFRKNIMYGGATSSISTKQQRTLLNTAHLWLVKQNRSAIHTEFRFDAVIFEGTSNAVNWIKNIFSG